MLFILNPDQKVEAVLSNDSPRACPYWGDKHTERLEDSLSTYEFTCPADHPSAESVVPENYVAFEDLDGNTLLFTIKTVTEQEQDGQYVKIVYAENTAISELNAAIIRPTTLNGYTAPQAMAYVLQGTGWELGQCDYLGAATIPLTDYPTALAGVHAVENAFGGEVQYRVKIYNNQITNRYVDLLERRGQDTGKRFEYQKDIIGVKRISDSTNLATAIIPLGKADTNGVRMTITSVNNNVDYIYDDEARDRWSKTGRHIFAVYIDEDAENPSDLLTRGRVELNRRKNPKFTYELDVLMLERKAGLDAEKVRLGDGVVVIDREFTPILVLQARIIELIRSYTDPTQDKATLGEFVEQYITIPSVINKLQSKLGIIAPKAEAAEVVWKGTEPPDDTSMLWLDMSKPDLYVWRKWDGSNWVAATPETASQLTYSDGSTIESLKPAQAGADVTSENTAADTLKVNGTEAAVITEAVGNFNARNDRNSTTPANPTIATDGTAIDHTVNTDGSVDISFEWGFNGSGDAYDIDGFIVYVRSSTSSSAYTFGSSPSEEAIFTLTPDKRAFILPGVAADKYYTFGVQAYRIVDNDIAAGGILKSSIVKSSASGENPYRPSSTVAFSGNITGTINGTSASTVVTNANAGKQASDKIANDVGSGTIETTSGSQQKAQDASNALRVDIEAGNITIPSSALQGALDVAKNAIQQGSNMVWDSGGLLLINPDDPTQVVRISSGGIGVSTDGGQNFITAMTGAGIAADAILTGFLSFDRAQGGELKVGLADRSGIFRVYKDAETIVGQVDESGASFTNLTAGKIISDSVVMRNYDPMNLYVDPTNGSDDNTGDSWANALATIQEAIDRIPKYNDGAVTIYIYYPSSTVNIFEDVSITGIIGGGSITIDFQSFNNVLNGSISATRCMQPIIIKNMKLVAQTSGGNAVFSLGTDRVYLNNCRIYGQNKAAYGVNAYSSYMRADSTYIYDCTAAAILSSYGSRVDVVNCDGNGNYRGLYAINTSFIGGSGTAPAGTTNQATGSGAQILGSFTYPSTAKTENPTSPTTTVYTFTSTSARSWRDKYGGWRSENNAYQGEWSGYGNHKGLWFFNSADMRSKLAGKTIKKVRLYVTRLSAGGSSAAQKPTFWYHNYDAPPSGEPTLTYQYTSPTAFAWGASGWVDLPYTWGNTFRDGTGRGVGIYDPDRTPYMIFSPNAKLEITVQ